MKKSTLFAISALFAGSLFAQTGTKPVANEEDIINAKEADEMPLYLHLACDKEADYETRKRCADKKMLEFVYKNVSFPVEARTQRKEGTAVIRFIVEKDGSMTDLSIARDPGYDMGAESLRVMQLMQSEGIVWNAGKKAGVPVRVQFHIPIRFKL